MPRFDGTGPSGLGAGTGQGLGPCGGGRAWGRRNFGPAFGSRRPLGYYSTPNFSKEEETKMLAEDAERLENELKIVKKRLDELKK